MSTVTYHAGATIISEGSIGDTAFMIRRGSVEVIVGEGKKAKTVATIEAGEVFGEMSLLEPGVRSATVKAVTETECVVTRYDEFMETIERNPTQAILYMKTLVMRLRQMNELMAHMDPKKRHLLDVFRDWQKSETERWENMSDEEKEMQNVAMMHMHMF